MRVNVRLSADVCVYVCVCICVQVGPGDVYVCVVMSVINGAPISGRSVLTLRRTDIYSSADMHLDMFIS